MIQQVRRFNRIVTQRVGALNDRFLARDRSLGEARLLWEIRDPIGCGALKFHDSEPALIKRMWVAESGRGLGIGRRILHELEDQAARHGAHAVQLETNKTLAEAISLYRPAGYVEVAPFNDEPYAHHWFEKPIAPAPAAGAVR